MAFGESTGPEVSLPVGYKESNPKDRVGVTKVDLSYVPSHVLLEVALGMIEGGYKYGRHNYRVVGVRASIYYAAAIRHLMAWWEGEDIDPDSGLSHITKAIASLVVIRDAMICDNWADDRPPKVPEGVMDEINRMARGLLTRYPDPIPPYTQKGVENGEY